MFSAPGSNFTSTHDRFTVRQFKLRWTFERGFVLYIFDGPVKWMNAVCGTDCILAVKREGGG